MVTRLGSGKVIKREAIQKSVEVLKGLPQKEKEEFALREAVYEMYQEIGSVLARGYSLDEVAEILSQNGVQIKGPTLKQYLTEIKRKKSKKRGGRSTGSKGIETTNKASSQAEVGVKSRQTGQAEKSRAKNRAERKVGQFTEIPDEL